jgi:hypothetical protein
MKDLTLISSCEQRRQITAKRSILLVAALATILLALLYASPDTSVAGGKSRNLDR